MNDWRPASQLQPLGENETHIWLHQLDLTSPATKRFYPFLSDEEKARSEKFIHFIPRKRFIVSHGFVRSVLALYLQQVPESLQFEKRQNGKPHLADESLHGIHFNMSHSQQLAVLAVCKQREVGIDVECLDRKNEWQKIIKRFFTPAEQHALFALPPEQQQRAFFQVWTRKEAHMKVTGQGLHLSPTRFTVSVPPSPAAVMLADSAHPDSHWHMRDIELPESVRNYCACVSVENSIGNLVKFIFQ